jgi:hypothetical protein
MADVGVEVTLAGPIFDGRAEQAVDDFLVEAAEVVAEQGLNDVLNALGGVLRNPTGYYESQIRTDRVSVDRVDVSDGGVVYGPWLAGVGSRNQTTDFAGYEHWQMATQALDGQADRVAEQRLAPYVDRMNG